MRYQFPRIEHIDQVRAAIEGRPEFVVAERPGYTVINYNVAFADTFPEVKTTNDAIIREARGIVFDERGDIMSRRYHKFFNINERPETLAAAVPDPAEAVALEKLDGSMITPLFIGDELRMATKMGLTDVAAPVDQFVAARPHYRNMMRDLYHEGYTPIFEWCSNRQRIVVAYPEDRLVLTAIRDTISGEYLLYGEMVGIANRYGVDVVRANEDFGDQDHEGVVIRYPDGHMLKVKTEWYVRLHKLKDNLMREKNVVDMIFNGNVDDIKPHLIPEDLKRLVCYEREVRAGVDETTRRIAAVINHYKDMSQRDFAVDVVAHMPEWQRPLLFRARNGDPYKVVVDYVRNHVGTQAQVDKIRPILAATWDYGAPE